MTETLSEPLRYRVQSVIDRWDCHADLLSVPVPIERIAQNEGWRILWGKLFPVYGYAVILDDVRLMRIDERIAATWQRFTIAHEMGHVIAGHTNMVELSISNRGVENPHEREASLIALSLLVPEFMRCGMTTQKLARSCNVPIKILETLGEGIGIATNAHYEILQPREISRRRRAKDGTGRLVAHRD